MRIFNQETNEIPIDISLVSFFFGFYFLIVPINSLRVVDRWLWFKFFENLDNDTLISII